jgi:hypothetical protein
LALKINNEITVVAVSRKPSLSKVKFADEVDKILQSISEDNFVFCGDMNINLFDAEDPAVAKYEDVMAEHGLLKLIDLLTREEFSGSNYSSTLIDHIYVRVKNLSHISAVLKHIISDHYSICAMLYVQTRDPTKHTFEYTDFKAVKKDLSSYNWNRGKNLNSPCKTLENCATYIESVKNAHSQSKRTSTFPSLFYHTFP